MNRKQKLCLWVGIFIITVVAIYPHWKATISGHVYYQGRRFFLNPPNTDYKIDKHRLCIEVAVVAALTGGLTYALKDKKPKDD